MILDFNYIFMKLLPFLRKRLLYVSMLTFVFVASTAFAFSETPVHKFFKSGNKTFPETPILKEASNYPVLSAQAALAVDVSSGVTLYEKDAEKKLLPASTTKIVTALVSMDYYPLDLILTVGNVKIEGQKMHLIKGEQIKVEDLLYGLLVYSANDAAEVLADNYPGGRTVFIEAMNRKAQELNLQNTNFSNPSGLDGNGHKTTAKDLVLVSEIAMGNPVFSEIVKTKQKTVASIDGKIVHRLTNINELIGKVEGVMGVKTGWTENARENLVTYVVRNNRKVMIAVLGSQDRFGETTELIEWIFKNYEWREVEAP